MLITHRKYIPMDSSILIQLNHNWRELKNYKEEMILTLSILILRQIINRITKMLSKLLRIKTHKFQLSSLQTGNQVSSEATTILR